MSKKVLILAGALFLTLVFSSAPAKAALVSYSDFTNWTNVVGSSNVITLDIGSQVVDGAIVLAGSPVYTNGSTTDGLKFDIALTGHDTPRFLYTAEGVTSMEGTFVGGGSGPEKLGFLVKPSSSGTYLLTLSDGSSWAQYINGGESGFFGWTGDTSINHMIISTGGSNGGFAFGNVVYTDESETSAVPEPATMLLFSLGGAGMLLRRFRQKIA